MECPFLTPYKDVLKLQTETPLITTFQPTTLAHGKTRDEYAHLVARLKADLHKHSVSIVSADKGSGLLLAANDTLQQMYEAYLTKNGTKVTPEIYQKSVHNLKTALMAISPSVYITNTDDRCPTFYFKIKIHKDAFQNSLHHSGKYPEVYRYTLHMDNLDLFVGISRPVVNHTGCNSTLCTSFLKYNLKRAISKCRYLTNDIFETVERLREAIPREHDLLCQPCTSLAPAPAPSTSTRGRRSGKFLGGLKSIVN